MDKKTFKELIPFRKDVYAKQLPNGAYTPVYQEISDSVIEKHLNGEETAGFYQLKEDKIKWAVLDIDLSKEVWAKDDFDVADWEQELMKQVDYAQDILSSNNISSYLEHSGHKGYHLWIFFEYPVKASKIREGMHRMFDDMKKADPHIFWEIFPKQDAVAETNLGSLVKGPSGFHHKSKQFSKFITPVDLKSVKYATEYDFVDQPALYAVVNKCRALKKLWHDSLAARECSHRDRVILATMYLNMGPDGREFFVKEFLSKLKNYDAEITKRQLDQMEEKIQPGEEEPGYKPFTCSLLQQENVCRAQCEEIGTRKSPIAFYYWSKGKDYNDSEFDIDDSINATSDKYKYKSDGIYTKDQKGNWKLESSIKMDIQKELYIDDGLTEEQEYEKLIEGDLILPGERIPFTMKTDVFYDTTRFKTFIIDKVPMGGITMPRDPEIIRAPALYYSNPERVIINKKIGWRQEEDDDYPSKYVMPSVVIDKEGIKENEDIIIDLRGDRIPSQLDFKIIDDDTYRETLEHMRLDLFPLIGSGNFIGYITFVFAMMPLYEPFIMAGFERTKFALWLRGETGAGKSYLLELMYYFYGKMEERTSWSATANAISRIGYFHGDTMFLIDDFKSVHVSGYEYKRMQAMIQNYADGTTRQRMTSSTKMQKEYPIEGWMVSTGEDLMMGEASSLARIFPIDVDKAKANIKKGNICQQHKTNYRGVPPRVIHHLLNMNPLNLRNKFDENYEEIYESISGRSNAPRIAKSVALLLTVAEDLFLFLYGKRFVNTELPYIRKELENFLDLHLTESEEELAFEQMMSTLEELISTKKVWMQAGPNSTDLSMTNNRGDLVGFFDTIKADSSGKKYPHLVIGRAYDCVQKNSKKSIEHSKKGIIQQLYDNGWSMDRKEKRRNFNGQSVSVVRLYPEKFNPEPNIEDEEE